MVKQKDATYTAIVNVTGFKGEGKCETTREHRAQIAMVLTEGFKSGEIAYEGDFNTLPDSKQKQYVSGLISNWLRKDERLNGGEKYVAKNPGSRAGSSDPQLKALRTLISKPDLSEAERTEIQGYIDARVSELNASKVKATVDFSALPAELAAKFQK